MARSCEGEGILDGDRVIRLNEPLPCKDGPVKVIVTAQAVDRGRDERGRAALGAFDDLQREPEELAPERWREIEDLIEAHPLRIRKGSPA